MNPECESLEQALKAGAIADIFRAQRAYALAHCISTHSTAINKSRHNVGELFGTIQDLAHTEFFLAVARLYDPSSERFPTRCLRSLLDHIEGEAQRLPTIDEKYNLHQHLLHCGMPEAKASIVWSAPDTDITKHMIEFFRVRIAEAAGSVERLKQLRDKRIAHNEAAHTIEGPTWNELHALLALAQHIVGAIGWAYLGTAYSIQGEYVLSPDSQRSASAMQRVLDLLEVAKTRGTPIQR